MSVSWLKQGEESAKAFEQEKAAAEKRKAEQGKAFRFFLPGPGEEASLWFVDGVLSPKGYLTPPRFYEHFVMFNGKWDNVVCPQQTDPSSGDKCPICEGQDRPSLVSLFTVIDTRPYTTKNGIVIPFTRKLFVAKPTTFELLNKLAVKRGGLIGCRFDVSRTSKKAAAVGDVFDFQEKATDMEAMRTKYTSTFKSKDKDGKDQMKTVCYWEALNYEKEIVFRTGDELRKMGFGAPQSSMPSEQAPQETPTESAGAAEDYKDHL